MASIWRITLFLAGFCLVNPLAAQDETRQNAQRQEENLDYYGRWLKEDVVYLITDEERSVFNGLSNDEEREQFIEQFWFRRDPNPLTPENEFKAEHYRRIAYANERFSSGLPGWMTDRGRVYIIQGPPAEIERHPTGGHYERPYREGGGSTMTYPFEIWRYRQIDGVGENVELEFVDDNMTGEYRLALMPDEKDALLRVAGMGETLAEELGLATKADRPYFSPANRESYPMMFQGVRDSPFARYETYSMVQRPAELKYPDLQELVKINVAFATLPLEVRQDYFRLNEQQVLVPITVQVDNRDLTFSDEGSVRSAKVAVYGLVTSISNRIISEFEDDLVRSYPAEEVTKALLQKSVYQKIVILDRKQRYKLNLVVKDLNGEKVGSLQKAIVPPAFEQEEIRASSLVLADDLQWLREIPEKDEMFVLGDVRVRPNVSREFTEDMLLGIYFQLYNAQFDQTTMKPSFETTFRLYRDGRLLEELVDGKDESIQYFSVQRVVMLRALSLEGLEPGKYQLKVGVQDRLSGQNLELTESFSILDRRKLAGR